MWRRVVPVFLCGLVIWGCTDGPPSRGLVVAPDVNDRRAQFVEQELTAEVSHLSEGDRQALRHLVAASRAVDEIFWLQAWAGNPELREVVATYDGGDASAVKDYYRIMYGPWDRLTHHEPFLGDRPHPEGAGFYPEDILTHEFGGKLGLGKSKMEDISVLEIE